MRQYIATFHTHLSAQRSHRALTNAGINAKLAPVPREVSSSCGICMRYESEDSCEQLMDTDLEGIYQISEEGYNKVIERE